MMVYVLLREDQNGYGYIDVTVKGLFRQKDDAQLRLDQEREIAVRQGLLVCGEAGVDDGEWDVSWSIEEHAVAATV